MQINTKQVWIIASVGILFFVVICALFVLPDRIPARHHMTGGVNRVGSKYELLVFPQAAAMVSWVLGRSSRRPRFLDLNLVILATIALSLVLRLLHAFELLHGDFNRMMMVVFFVTIAGIVLVLACHLKSDATRKKGWK
ncbi:MAG: hypothetical protein Q4A52_02485 [Bacillota bacterium]|nr:hypothetical protein [Bacillota bacterium]